MNRSRIISSAGAVLAATLVIAPAAQAGQRTPDSWAVRPTPNALIVTSQAQLLPDDRADRGGPSALVMPAAITVRSTPAAFNWGDAAIGAGAAFGLTLAAAGTAAGIRSRRRELAA